MARPRKYKRPPKAKLERELAKEGIMVWAERNNVPPTTVSNWCREYGIKGSKEPQALDDKPVDDPERLARDRLKAENKALRKENREYAKALADQAEFYERIVEECQRPVRARNLVTKAQPKNLPKRSVVCPIFDVQYGQHVRPEDTPGGRGAYNTAIFDKRLARWFEGVTGSIRDYAASHRLTELVIPMGGDFVEGHGIFPGQEWQLEIDPARQVWEFACKFGGDDEAGTPGALRELIAFAKEEIGIPKIRIYLVPGNHGKPGGRKAGALHSTHSWDWLTGMFLRDKLRKEPVNEFAIEPGGALYFGCEQHVFLMIHGDEIRGWGGLPYYGLSRYDGKSIRQGHIIHDYLLMGDKHVPAEIEQGGGGETLMSGAWVGENNLSRQLGAAARPQQRLYFVAEKWGVTESCRIFFQEAAAAREPTAIYDGVA